MSAEGLREGEVARIELVLDEHGLWSADAWGPERPEGTSASLHDTLSAALWKVTKRALTQAQLEQAFASVEDEAARPGSSR